MIEQLSVSTSKRNEYIDITSSIEKAVKKSKVKGGICVVFTPHTTTAITINENADPDVQRDLLMKLDKLASDPKYSHTEGNSDAHVKSSIIGCSETVIIKNSSLLLGTWQCIYFCEHDGPRKRKVFIKVMGD